MNSPTRRFYFLKGYLVFILLNILIASANAANYSLQIIQPQPNLDTKNRYYKAYPGLDYNVRLAVIGGEFPYRFELTTAPAGMTIDKRGEINWSNPVASGVPYNVTALVTDAVANTQSVSWTITVTTSGFRFIDAINGKSAAQGGTGTISNPWKSMIDMYEGNDYASKTANSYAGEFVYWRNGTYPMEGYVEDNGWRIPFVNNYKPVVWLAYPGETPVINMGNAYLAIYGGGSNTYFDGLDFNVNGNTRGMGITIDSNANNVTFRRNKLHGITTGYTGGNDALIFIARSTAGSNYSIQDNEMFGNNNGYGILGYAAKNVLVENNTFHQISGHPIGPKEGTQMWFIRSNHMYDNSQDSIGLQYSNSNGIQSGDIEISYNLVEAGGGKVRINSNQTSSGLPVYIFRNTFMDQVEMLKATSTNGPFYFTQNVIVNGTSYPDKIQRTLIDDTTHVIVTDNLTGGLSDNIVDSGGNLTSKYSTYIGSRGYQVGNPPSPPTGLRIAN